MISKQAMQIPGWHGGDGDAAYLDKTLRYQDVEVSLDESVNWRVILQLFLYAFIAAFLIWFGFAFLTALIATVSFTGATTMLSIGTLLSSIAFWIVLLFSKLPEPIAEWRVLLHDRTDKAESVYSQISGALARRQIPIRGSCHRIRTGLNEQDVSNRLILANGNYVAYVSVFGYGTSLYLGWVMWRTRRGTELIRQFLADLIGSMFGWNDPERRMLRTERPRAMREAVHSACREGLFVAIEGIDVPEHYGFPQGMPPVEGQNATHAAPVPTTPRFSAPVPTAPQQPQDWHQSPPGHPRWEADGRSPQQP
ncbi:MAG: hypothetical protein ACRDTG_17250 [Pseudonocardiaceae bacterium]